MFHKILKSDCRAEDARLGTAERLARLIPVFCILTWRVFRMTMINRSAPHTEPGLALTDVETTLLDRLVPDKVHHATLGKTLSRYLIKIAWGSAPASHAIRSEEAMLRPGASQTAA